MFCSYCGRQNKDNVVFCEFCGKALPQKGPPTTGAQSMSQANHPPQKQKPKIKLSFTAIKALITGIVIIGLLIVVFQIYYPGLLPWNW